MVVRSKCVSGVGVAQVVGRRELIRADWPQFNHDGGELQFGPDGFLYISMGDGGGADDDGIGHGDGNAQNLANHLGKILRIDVHARDSSNGPYGIPDDNPFVGISGALEEIYAYGFRNPFRFSFDRRTGTLIAGDVGQNDIEEVDVVVAGGNYGWNRKEGTLFFDPNGDERGFATRDNPGDVPADVIDPIAQYDTHHEGHSVIGGFVYRGRMIRELRGQYVFGDFSGLFKLPSGPHDYGRLFHLSLRSLGRRHHRHKGRERLGRIREFHIVGGNALALSLFGFGEDANGELYAVGNISGVPFGDTGRVLRILPGDADRTSDDSDKDSSDDSDSDSD